MGTSWYLSVIKRVYTRGAMRFLIQLNTIQSIDSVPHTWMNDVFKYLGNRFQLLLWFGLFVFYFWSYSFKATGSFMLMYSFSKTISISSLILFPQKKTQSLITSVKTFRWKSAFFKTQKWTQTIEQEAVCLCLHFILTSPNIEHLQNHSHTHAPTDFRNLNFLRTTHSSELSSVCQLIVFGVNSVWVFFLPHLLTYSINACYNCQWWKGEK